jgi:hypothetical protein
MNYRVQNKGYWEERRSVREGKKVRSVFVRYLGRVIGPAADINWSEAFRSDPGTAAERAAEKADALRGPEVEEPSRLPSGLHVGPVDPTPVEPAPTESAEGSQEAPEPANGPSEPDAPAGSDDASESSSLE